MTLRDAVIARGLWLLDWREKDYFGRGGDLILYKNNFKRWAYSFKADVEIQCMVDWALSRGVKL